MVTTQMLPKVFFTEMTFWKILWTTQITSIWITLLIMQQDNGKSLMRFVLYTHIKNRWLTSMKGNNLKVLKFQKQLSLSKNQTRIVFHMQVSIIWTKIKTSKKYSGQRKIISRLKCISMHRIHLVFTQSFNSIVTTKYKTFMDHGLRRC